MLQALRLPLVLLLLLLLLHQEYQELGFLLHLAFPDYLDYPGRQDCQENLASQGFPDYQEHPVYPGHLPAMVQALSKQSTPSPETVQPSYRQSTTLLDFSHQPTAT